MQALLSEALGVLGVVRKERLLYLVGQTRVHLDRVDGLGDFMELEVSGAGWEACCCVPSLSCRPGAGIVPPHGRGPIADLL